MQRNDVDDALIKVLGHGERREILRILETTLEGVKYSGILGEGGLTTSKLNYQLKEMEGFIEKHLNNLFYVVMTLFGVGPIVLTYFFSRTQAAG
ncbi:helix-turn-helix transcriptional regulator [Candidatus Bathyarchaeota archaeon]|nr:helix-turn-helix transcriptional regulator [Candidatus Bathyarchaeota archaeon]